MNEQGTALASAVECCRERAEAVRRRGGQIELGPEPVLLARGVPGRREPGHRARNIEGPPFAIMRVARGLAPGEEFATRPDLGADVGLVVPRIPGEAEPDFEARRLLLHEITRRVRGVIGELVEAGVDVVPFGRPIATPRRIALHEPAGSTA